MLCDLARVAVSSDRFRKSVMLGTTISLLAFAMGHMYLYVQTGCVHPALSTVLSQGDTRQWESDWTCVATQRYLSATRSLVLLDMVLFPPFLFLYAWVTIPRRWAGTQTPPVATGKAMTSLYVLFLIVVLPALATFAGLFASSTLLRQVSLFPDIHPNLASRLLTSQLIRIALTIPILLPFL